MVTFLLVLGGLIGGAILNGMFSRLGGDVGGRITTALFERADTRKGRVNISGTWHAVWQTTALGKLNINTELVTVQQKGRKVSMRNLAKSEENTAGGYLWEAAAQIHDNKYVIGAYHPTEANVTARGAIYFVVNPTGQFMVGRWVGTNIDHEITGGIAVFARDKSFAIVQMNSYLTGAMPTLPIPIEVKPEKPALAPTQLPHGPGGSIK